MGKPKKGSSVNKTLLASAAVITLSAGVATPAHAASGTGPMTAILLTPITVSGTAPLHFGSFTVDTAGSGGAVTVDTAGTRTKTVIAPSDLTLVTGGGLEQAGNIVLSAATGITLDLSIPAGAFTDTQGGVAVAGGYQLGVLATPTNTATTMVAGNFILGTPTAGVAATPAPVGFGAGDSVTNINLTAASINIPLGGTLLAKANNTAGTYTGTYNLVANYQ